MTTQTKDTKDVAQVRKTLPELLNDESTKKRFAEMLGKDARSFMQNILTVYNGPGSLQSCDPESIIAAAGISASINLSLLPSLGHSCLVPYKDKATGRTVATWQIMWKGIVQLAHRSGQYAKVNMARVYEGQLISHDEHKQIVTLRQEKKSNRVIGYFFYFRLKNGAEFEFYWPVKKCIEHGLRFSKSFQDGSGKWTEDPEFKAAGNVQKWLALPIDQQFLTEGSGADAMSAKSLVKNELNKWGPLETRIKELVQDFDQAAIGADGRPVFVDTTAVTVEPTPKYVAPPMNNPDGSKPTDGQKIATAREFALKQGITSDHFELWIKQFGNDEEAAANACRAAWQSVAKKECTAAEAFALPKKIESEAAAPAAVKVEFSVYGVAESEFNGEPAICIRDTSEPAVKYFTDVEIVVKAATGLKGDKKKKLSAWAVEKDSDGKKFQWLTELAD